MGAATINFKDGKTAIVLVDPYNDFLSEGGKLWPQIADVAVSVDLISHLKVIVAAARAANAPIIFAPHHRAEPNDLEHWDHPTPYQRAGSEVQAFAKDSWGGSFREEFQAREGDIVAREHWTASGFANTDLDFQLKQRGIVRIVVIGLVANTCIEGTARAGVDLGYEVILVRDATAAFSHDAMRAAHEINAPNYAHAVVTTAELLSYQPEDIQ